jgi:protease-4
MLTLPFRLLANLWRLTWFLIGWLLLWPLPLLRRRSRRFLRLELKGRIHLAEDGGLFARRSGVGSFEALDHTLRRAERDARIEGVLVEVGDLHLAPTDAETLRARLLATRAANKRVCLYFESAGPSELVLASAADTVFMAPAGHVTAPGLSADLVFAAPALAKVGVRAQFVHIGRYKTAANTFTRGEASEAQRASTRTLLTDLDEAFATLTARDAAEAPHTWPLPQPFYEISEARRAGLVDHQAFPDQLEHRLRAERVPPEVRTGAEGESEGDADVDADVGDAAGAFDPYGHMGDDALREAHEARMKAAPRVALVSPGAHAGQLPRRLRWKPLIAKRKEIAVVELEGMIVPDTASGSPLRPPRGIAPEPVRRVLDELRDAPRVRAIVLAIDSRGGSALASDLIWREVRRATHAKPVVACFGSVAASGGYYIAAGATEIMAAQTTITGSIGVIAGKFSVDGALSLAGIGSETIGDGPFASMFSPRHPFTPEQIEALRADMRIAYRRFVNRVATGRGFDSEAVHRLGRGQVYLGARAQRLGLVDAIGTVGDAIERAAVLADLPRDRADVGFYPLHRVGLLSRLRGDALGLGGALAGITDASALAAWVRRAEPAADELLGLVTACGPGAVLAYEGLRV